MYYVDKNRPNRSHALEKKAKVLDYLCNGLVGYPDTAVAR